MKTQVLLPKWATLQTGTAADIASRPIVDVDAGAMYKAFLAEYSAFYKDRTTPEFRDQNGKVRAEWTKGFTELRASPATAYWLEVCYQSCKMELQIAMRSFGFEIHIHDKEKGKGTYVQAKREQGRGAHLAASAGQKGGREAREHFKRLRGFIPS